MSNEIKLVRLGFFKRVFTPSYDANIVDTVIENFITRLTNSQSEINKCKDISASHLEMHDNCMKDLTEVIEEKNKLNEQLKDSVNKLDKINKEKDAKIATLKEELKERSLELKKVNEQHAQQITKIRRDHANELAKAILKNDNNKKKANKGEDNLKSIIEEQQKIIKELEAKLEERANVNERTLTDPMLKNGQVLNCKQVAAILTYLKEGKTPKELADQYGVNQTTIRRIGKGQTYRKCFEQFKESFPTPPIAVVTSTSKKNDKGL